MKGGEVRPKKVSTDCLVTTEGPKGLFTLFFNYVYFKNEC